MTKLFIIGNGFDKAHGLLTDYNDFHEWLKKTYPEVERNISIILKRCTDYQNKKANDLWCSLEENLINFDNFFFEEAAGDYYNEDLTEYENKALGELELTTNIINQLRIFFAKWINSIEITSSISELPYDLSSDDYYVTFNYTLTLEKLYGIPKESVLHIHGSQNDKMIMGHNNKYFDEFNHIGIDPDGDVDLMHGDAEDDYKTQELRYNIKRVQESVYKPIEERLIPMLDEWLAGKDNPKAIIVLGHSYGMIDSKYFNFLKEKYRNSSWTYSVYDQETEDRLFTLLAAQREKNRQKEDDD